MNTLLSMGLIIGIISVGLKWWFYKDKSKGAKIPFKNIFSLKNSGEYPEERLYSFGQLLGIAWILVVVSHADMDG